MNLVKHAPLRITGCAFMLCLSSCGALQQGVSNLNDSQVAIDSAEAASQTAALAYVTIDPLASSSPATAQEAATKAAAAAQAAFSGSACVTASVDAGDATKVVYTLANCSGPFGLVRASGKLTASYAKNGSQFTVVLASSDSIKVGAGQLTVAATIVTTDLANQRTVNVTTTSTAVGLLGRSIAHAGSYSATWDQSQCLTLNGSFTTTDNNVQSATVISDYQRCLGQCAKKGIVTLTTASLLSGSKVIQVTYSGMATATVTITSGTSGQVSGTAALPACGS